MHQYDIRDLRIHFPTRRGVVEAVRGVSFYMDQGECVALVGESGCGKSVTARSLMGLTEVTGGRCQPGSQILWPRGEHPRLQQEAVAELSGPGRRHGSFRTP